MQQLGAAGILERQCVPAVISDAVQVTFEAPLHTCHVSKRTTRFQCCWLYCICYTK